MSKQETCAERIGAQFASTVESLREILDSNDEDSGIYDYGLSFDWVDPDGKRAGYYRWQLSWGGPSDEIRFYPSDEKHRPVVEYAFMDWFDGATVDPSGDDLDTILEAWEHFVECLSDGPYSYE